MGVVTATSQLSIYDLYREVVAKSRALGHVKVRRSLYVNEMTRCLRKLGGIQVWVAAVGLSLAGLVLSPHLLANVSPIAMALSATLAGYLCCLQGFSGFYVDVYVLVRGQAAEESIYARVAEKAYNRLTLGVLLPGLLLFALTTSLAWAPVSSGFVALVGMAAVFAALLNGLSWLWKNITDFVRIFSAIAGRKSTVVRDTEELVRAVVAMVAQLVKSRPLREPLIRLAESDLRRAEMRLELLNIAIALGAIVISVLFSSQLTAAIAFALEALSQFIGAVSVITSDLLAMPLELRWLSYTGVSVALWLFVTNLLLGASFLIARSLSSVYFAYYRPAHALYQALLVVDSLPPQLEATLPGTGPEANPPASQPDPPAGAHVRHLQAEDSLNG